jgi:nucleoside-diphosphate-sugar epimerase
LSYYYSFGLPVTIARPFNTYGPRQSARAVIPSVIIQAAKRNQLIDVGDITTTRDFNFVEDTCRGFIALAENETSSGEVFNIGSNSEISIKDTISVIQKIMGTDIPLNSVTERKRPETSEVFRLCCENSKIRNSCGYEPSYSLENGLKKTIDWFRNSDNLSKYKSGGHIL